MKKTNYAVLFLFAAFHFCPGLVLAQSEPFALRQDSIGESLEQFRANNATMIAGKTYPLCSGDAGPAQERPQVPSYSSNYKQFQSQMAAYDAAVAEYDRHWDSMQLVLDASAHEFGEDIECVIGPGFGGTIASAPGHLFYHFKSGKLDLINGDFDSADFATVRDAVIAKYGSPTSAEESKYTNRLGAHFSGETVRWLRSDSQIILDQIGTKIDESSILIANPETIRSVAAKRADNAMADF